MLDGECSNAFVRCVTAMLTSLVFDLSSARSAGSRIFARKKQKPKRPRTQGHQRKTKLLLLVCDRGKRQTRKYPNQSQEPMIRILKKNFKR